MSIKTARLAPTGGNAVLATSPAVVHAVHWTGATSAAGTVTLHDGASATTVSRLIIDTPKAQGNLGAGGDFTIPGGGLRFNTKVFGAKSDTGGVTIVYEDYS